MAIVIELPLGKSATYKEKTYTSKWIAGYNDNYIQWKTDTEAGDPDMPGAGGVILRGEIWIGDYKFTNLKPDPETGIFTFNIYEAVTTILGNFGDTYLHLLADIIKSDETLYKNIAIALWIEFTDGTKETDNTEIKACRAVHQIGDLFGETMINFEPGYGYSTEDFFFNNRHALLKSEKISFDQLAQQGSAYNQNLKIFKGYPLDVGFISSPENTELKIITTGNDDVSINTTTQAVELTSWINRVVLSDGVDLHTSLAGLSLDMKYRMVLQLNDTDTDNIFPFNFEITDDCGIYLKWMNSEGGWSHWLFNKYYKQPRSVKSLGRISDYNKTLIGTQGNYSNIGQASDVNIHLSARFIPYEYFIQVAELPTAPILYMYTGKKGALPTVNDWLKITVDDYKDNLRDNERKLYDVSLIFSLPNQYAQSL